MLKQVIQRLLAIFNPLHIVREPLLLECPERELRVRRAVFRVVGQDVDPATIDDDTPLFSSGLLDSFATAELLAAVEEAAGVTIGSPNLEDGSFDTIGGILRGDVARSRQKNPRFWSRARGGEAGLEQVFANIEPRPLRRASAESVLARP